MAVGVGVGEGAGVAVAVAVGVGVGVALPFPLNAAVAPPHGPTPACAQHEVKVKFTWLVVEL